MRSHDNVKLPPIFTSNDQTRATPTEIELSSGSGSNSSSTSSRRFKSFKQVVKIVGKNSKWTKQANEEVQDDQLKKITAEEKRLTFNVSGKFLSSVSSLIRFVSTKMKFISNG